MAYSEALADRIRDALTGRAEVSEREMFGGIAFMLGGNMAVGVIGEDLMVRLGPDGERALAEPVEAGAVYAASLPPKPGAPS